jgi:hypothetical protein
VLAAVGITVVGERQRLDRLVNAQVGDVLKGECNASTNVLADDGAVDAAQLG